MCNQHFGGRTAPPPGCRPFIWPLWQDFALVLDVKNIRVALWAALAALPKAA
jgi:hypothetical protein